MLASGKAREEASGMKELSKAMSVNERLELEIKNVHVWYYAHAKKRGRVT